MKDKEKIVFYCYLAASVCFFIVDAVEKKEILLFHLRGDVRRTGRKAALRQTA